MPDLPLRILSINSAAIRARLTEAYMTDATPNDATPRVSDIRLSQLLGHNNQTDRVQDIPGHWMICLLDLRDARAEINTLHEQADEYLRVQGRDEATLRAELNEAQRNAGAFASLHNKGMEAHAQLRNELGYAREMEAQARAQFTHDQVELAKLRAERDALAARLDPRPHEQRAREWVDGAHAVHGGERTYESDIRSLAAEFASVAAEATQRERERCAALRVSLEWALEHTELDYQADHESDEHYAARAKAFNDAEAAAFAAIRSGEGA